MKEGERKGKGAIFSFNFTSFAQRFKRKLCPRKIWPGAVAQAYNSSYSAEVEEESQVWGYPGQSRETLSQNKIKPRAGGVV